MCTVVYLRDTSLLPHSGDQRVRLGRQDARICDEPTFTVVFLWCAVLSFGQLRAARRLIKNVQMPLGECCTHTKTFKN